MDDFYQLGGQTPRNLRILLHILPFAQRAGCEMDCYRLIKALPDFRHEILVLHTKGEMSDAWVKIGARVSHLECLDLPPPKFVAEVARSIVAREFSGGILWSITRFSYILHALRGLDIPICIHVGNPIVKGWRRKLNYFLTERAFAPLPGARLLACSEHVRRSLRVEPIFASMPAEVVYNPIEVTPMSHTPRVVIAESRVRIGMVARLDPIKDHRTLLKAWREIVRFFPNAILELAGDGELRNELEELSETLGIRGSVAFLGHISDVASVSQHWDVFVYSTTNQEGLGNALVEALALGLPSVVCDLPVMREVCGEGDAVAFFQAQNHVHLAQVIINLLPDLKRRKEIGLVARERVSTIFDPALCARKHLAALNLSPSAPMVKRLFVNKLSPRGILLHISPLAMQAGCEMNSLRIIRALVEFEHYVLVLDRSGPMTEIWREAGATVEHLGALSESRLAFYAKLRRFLQCVGKRPEGIIYWSTSRLALVSNAARAASAPLVAHVGNPARYSFLQSARARIDELALPAVPGTRLAACSTHVKMSLPNSSYLRRFPVDVIYNPVELPTSQHEVRILQREVPIRLGMVARIDPIKDHATALRAMKILRQRFSRVTLEFAGDGELRSVTERMAKQFGLEGSVRFLGHVPNVNRLLLEWDIFVYSTTTNEGLGNALIEALAIGLPCVVSDLPMMREVCGDDGACLYFKTGDEMDLARQVTTLLEDLEQRRDVANKGRVRVAHKFAPKQAAKRYLEALKLSL